MSKDTLTCIMHRRYLFIESIFLPSISLLILLEYSSLSVQDDSMCPFLIDTDYALFTIS